MKTKCYFSPEGTLLNIGEWDRQVVPATTEPEVVLKGKVVRPARSFPEQVKNEIPADAVVEWRDVVETSEGRFLASDYASLRRTEYPRVPDQLDALWKGGAEAEEMRAKVLAVKAKYPKG